jgi:hypothetical protein
MALLQLRRRNDIAETGRFPWERGHAAPEDQAFGLELELIELERRRRDQVDGDRLDPEIDSVREQLATLVASLPVAV